MKVESGDNPKIRTKRPDFLATMTPEEKAVTGQHQAYVRQLFDQGKIVLGGVATNGAIGVIVGRVDSAEAGMVKQIFMLNRSYEE